MRDLIHSVEFWVAMAVAILIKMRASPKITRVGRAMSAAIAVGCALVFTEPTLAYLSLESDSYTIAVAALWALTGEHIARQFLTMTLADLVAFWRGEK